MIYSAYEENWNRVNHLYSVAVQLYNKTKDTEFRNRILTNNANTFPFDAIAFDIIMQERCVVEMAIAWSVITIESLVNYYIAITKNHSDAKIIINKPFSIKVSIKNKSELEQKVSILSNEAVTDDIRKKINRIVTIRNEVVHDKPFMISEDHDLGAKVEFFTEKEVVKRKIHFENLKEVFDDCDLIIDFISQNIQSYDQISSNVNFLRLLQKA